jgi:hypothetical protein
MSTWDWYSLHSAMKSARIYDFIALSPIFWYVRSYPCCQSRHPMANSSRLLRCEPRNNVGASLNTWIPHSKSSRSPNNNSWTQLGPPIWNILGASELRYEIYWVLVLCNSSCSLCHYLFYDQSCANCCVCSEYIQYKRLALLWTWQSWQLLKVLLQVIKCLLLF